MLNTATSLISDVIGNDVKGSAFVYGCYCFIDKSSSGVIVAWIFAKYIDAADGYPDPGPIRAAVCVIPPLCAVAAFFLTLIGRKTLPKTDK